MFVGTLRSVVHGVKFNCKHTNNNEALQQLKRIRRYTS
jgi:hypothetical protein